MLQLAFWVGHVRASEQVALYRHSVGRLAAELDQLEKEHIGARTSGIIVNTSGWVDGDGYEALIHAAEVLHVDTIVVIADDRLYSRLTVCARERVRGSASHQPARVCPELTARLTRGARVRHGRWAGSLLAQEPDGHACAQVWWRRRP